MKYGIAITSYNRYDYVQEFIESFERTHILDETTILVSDDNSEDERVRQAFQGFKERNPQLDVILSRNTNNMGSKAHYLNVMSRLRDMGCDYLINIDSDSIFNPNWMTELDKLLQHFDYNILGSVFFTDTSKTTDPSNWIKEYNDDYVEKNSLNGLGLALPSFYVDQWEIDAREGRYEHFDAYIGTKRHDYNMKCFSTKISYMDHIGETGVNSRPGALCDKAINFAGDKNE